MSTTNIPVIALTGGPCAGKTTILSFLEQRLQELGFRVVTVDEVATQLISSGLTPDRLGNFRFQHLLFAHTREKEDRWKEAAALAAEGDDDKLSNKVVVLCDRGLPDAAAYMGPAAWDLMLAAHGITVTDIRDARYDAAVFLRSVAVDLPEVYTCANNAARKETVAEACTLDARTLAAWTGHPHLAIIDNQAPGGVEAKARKTLQAICRVLGIPVPLEIERKYRIARCDLTQLPQPSEQVHIVQYYLTGGGLPAGAVERIRMRGCGGGHTYYHTVKQEIRPSVRSEVERRITREEYYELLRRADPQLGKVEKHRHCFVFNGQYFELDIFRRPAGLILLELELTEEGQSVSLPPFLADYATDVTDVREFSNYDIAKQIAAQGM